MFRPATTRAVLLLTVFCWTVQPTLSRSAALCEASKSATSEIDRGVDWEKLEVTYLSTSAVDICFAFLSARVSETVALPMEVNIGCLEHLRGPPRA